MKIDVTRHYATVGPIGAQRQIHYRRAGSGPPVVLLHQSPLSSLEMMPLLHQLAPTHTVIAPDTPGFGFSDPFLEADVTMELMARNLALLLDALGIDAVALYGYHTGASIATAFARHFPKRCVVAVAEGVLCLNDAERHEFLTNYLVPLVPQWDGGHLTWLWSRLRDQTIFFPWYMRTAAARMTRDIGSVPAIASDVLDMLRAGDNYRPGYRAAMAYDPPIDLRELNVAPYYLVCRTIDPLRAHLERVPPLTSNMQIQVYETKAEFEASLHKIMQAAYQRPAAPPSVAVAPMADHPWMDFVSVRGQHLRIMRAGDATKPLAVVVHGAQGSLRSCTELAAGLAQHHSVLVIELPGHGATDALPTSNDMSIESVATLLNEALDVLGVTTCDYVGVEAGAAIQVEMQRQRRRARSLTLINAIDVTGDVAAQSALQNSYQSIEHDAWGGYLLQAWHQARNHMLMFPWFERRRSCGVNETPMLDEAELQQQTLDLLISADSGVALRKAETRYPLRERLSGLNNVKLAAPSWHPRAVHTQQLASTEQFIALPREWRQAGQVIVTS